MTMIHKEEPQATRLLEQLYELSLSDRMIAALCAKTPGQVASWRQEKGYPPNDHDLPYNPSTGRPFSPQEMRRAIERALSAYKEG